MMRSIPNHRSSLFICSALAGALAFCASPLMAEEQLGNFEIQVVDQAPPGQQPSTAIQSPRDAASGQATGIQSPRDAASGQATGIVSDNKHPEGIISNDARVQQGTAGGKPANEMINGQSGGYLQSARGTETANTGQWAGGSDDGSSIRRDQPGSGANAPCISECQKQIDLVRANPEAGSQGQFMGGSNDGQGIRKPRPNKGPRKGRRIHKP